MIDQYNNKRTRLIGQPRKNPDIYTHLGHPSDIKNTQVTFIGNEEKTYALTKNKTYTIIDTTFGTHCFDQEMKKTIKKKIKQKEKNIQTDQSEEHFIIIKNDKGNKRKYSHLMFKKTKQEDTKK